MSRQRYIEVIRRLAALSGLGEQEANSLTEGGALDIGGVLFSLVYGDKESPHLMLVYCDFGEVPRGREAEIYHALMEINLSMYTGAGPVFGVSPYTKRVLLALHYPLDGLEVDKLRDSLSQIAGWAQQWRTNFFLEPKNARPSSGARENDGDRPTQNAGV